MYTLSELGSFFNTKLADFKFDSAPEALYEPIDYIMSLGGKRIRPILLLASYNMYDESIDHPFEAALAFEVFHNFSLVHDDIMDDADIRRGKAATHIKYNVNAAILSGDAMLIIAYRLIEKYKSNYSRCMKLFSKTALEVCEGQRLDMDFEELDDISIEDYIEMISLKTSVLVAACLGMGAILADSNAEDVDHLYQFGKNLGIAFQIQDDILDTFGDASKVGKRIGGDIIQKKKTYLYLKSLELLSEVEQNELRELYQGKGEESQILVDKVVGLFERAHVKLHAQELKLVYQQLAMSHLDAVSVSEDKKSILRQFPSELLDRSS